MNRKSKRNSKRKKSIRKIKGATNTKKRKQINTKKSIKKKRIKRITKKKSKAKKKNMKKKNERETNQELSKYNQNETNTQEDNPEIEETKCRICDEDLKNQPILALSVACNHVFHKSCISQSPLGRQNCPTCGQPPNGFTFYCMDPSKIKSCSRCWNQCHETELQICLGEGDGCTQLLCQRCVSIQCEGCRRQMQYCKTHSMGVLKMRMFDRKFIEDLFCPECRDYPGVL